MKLLIAVSLLLTVRVVCAQSNEQTGGQKNLDWYNYSLEKEQVYGAEINQAYQFLKGKKTKAKPIIALIGGGIDLEHEALKNNVWTNPKEKDDSIDNDGNGYVDDLHGWNFLGNKDGQVLENLTVEGDREFLRLKDKYAHYIFDGKNYFKYINGEKTNVAPPADMEEYEYYQKVVLPSSKLGVRYNGFIFGNVLRDYAKKFDKEMKERFPDKTSFTVEDLSSCWDRKGPQDSLGNIAMFFIGMDMDARQEDEKAWEKTYDYFVGNGYSDRVKKAYEPLLKEMGMDLRKEIVGDDYKNINDRVYGNNVLLTLNSESNTMAAGIIAGKRGIEGRNNPIAEEAQIMNLVVATKMGEPYLKDIALSIRYAVEHQADIILLEVQNTVYPKEQKQWIIEAIRYAESKGVLVVIPTMDLSFDLSKVIFYPNRRMDKEKELTNLMVVGSSDKSGNPAIGSNYGVEGIDLFAPGMNIFSTYLGDTYQSGSSPILAAATVVGIAALIKTYYPQLTGSQIRDILLKTVTSRRGVEIQKNYRDIKNQIAEDLFLFDQLCLSGGIVNAYQALVEADKRVK
ncbi:S8 family serine peptidase [Butyricimonas sp. Marseille-P2440]|uniref:S8 family serine peptidase n=1 Tax=Butyricimonas TaxID=574697 RepID=UPI00350EA4F4